jgi:hypothetical protein
MKTLVVLSVISLGTAIAAASPSLANPTPYRCTCSFKSLPIQGFVADSRSSGMDSLPMINPADLTLSQIRSILIADGPPSDDKGTPGNRGDQSNSCQAYQCGVGTAQMVPTQNRATPTPPTYLIR